MLSDGWLDFPKDKNNARLGFSQSFGKFEYFWHVFNILEHYCAGLPTFQVRKRTKNLLYSLTLQTRRLSCFSEIHKMFYSNGKKIIPSDIYNLLDPVCLAHWIMGDGKYVATDPRGERFNFMYKFLFFERSSNFTECINYTLRFKL